MAKSFLLGKRVKLIYDDGSSTAVYKKGTISNVDSDFFYLKQDDSDKTEVLNKSRVIRMEVLSDE